jgi:hypothetical protein
MLQQYKNICLILFALSLFSALNAQDSLYLVGTITGESYQKRITNVDRVGDVNGDGFDDFMIASRTGKIRRDQGIVQLFLGSATLDLTPDVTFHYPCCDSVNNMGYASEIGDVNNDGYDDFAISTKFADAGFNKGKVFLYYGSETIDTIPVAAFFDPWIQDYFGEDVEAVGDLNQDGYDDFTFSSKYNWTNGLGYVYLFWGSDTIAWDKSITFTSNVMSDYFGESSANIGNINNDGFEDLAIGAPNKLSGNDFGKAYVYLGSLPLNVIPDTIFMGNYIYENFGSIITNGGDLNNDNFTEYFISGGKFVYIYSIMDNNFIINGFEQGFGGYINIAANCNLNDDAYGDFIIGNTNYRNSDSLMVGGAFVYFGGENIDTTFKIKLEGENKWDEFSRIMTTTDINGDSCDELLVLAPNYPDFENALGKVYIYSSKKLTEIEDYKENFLNNYALYQNYPNPFNPNTSIQYAISSRQFVTLKVYDVLGKEVATLVNEEKSAGEFKVEFNATKYKLSSGVYFCELKTKESNSSRIKMVLIK